MKKIISIIVLSIQIFLLCACGSNSDKSDKLQVYTSFYAMHDFASRIGGEKADVYMLCPPGQEPHDFEPTAQDMAKLSQADIFIYNGMGMEHWAEKVAKTLPETVTIIEASSFVNSDNSDPHVWLNPQNAYDEMNGIADGFIEKDGANKEYYEKQLNKAKELTDDLYDRLRKACDMFTTDTIIVSHDAYSHLCDLLGVTQMPVNGTDNSGEPTPQRIAEIESYIKDNNIKYVFCEPMGTSDIMDTIAKDTGCEILTLDPFEGRTDGGDYSKTMQENIGALTEALN